MAGAAAGALLPAGAQGPVSAALGRHDSAFAVRRAHGVLGADNPRQRLSVRFGRSDVVVAAGRTRVGLRLARYGRGTTSDLVGAPSRIAASNQVVYRYHGVRESFVNGPAGLEQIFKLRSAPVGRGSVSLSIALAGNARAVRSSGAIVLRAAGGPSLAYRGLQVTDATGRRLPARLGLHGSRLSIVFDDSHARYPVTVDPFVQQARLTASDGVSEDDFGTSVAVAGDTLFVGAIGKGGAPTFAGDVYVFTKPASGWATATETAQLQPPAMSPAFYGESIAVDGDTLVVGAPGNGSPGAAYVYSEPAGGWSGVGAPVATLTDGTGQANGFGAPVAVSGDTIAVAAIDAPSGGQVDVFTEPAGGWTDATPTASLTAAPGDSAQELGRAIAISGDTIAVGAPVTTVSGATAAGEVLLFTEPAGGWTDSTETAKLTATVPTYPSLLGDSLAFDGHTIVAGAPANGNGPPNPMGAAYVFTKPANGWTNLSSSVILTPSPRVMGGNFGAAVALLPGGDDILVGAPTTSPATVYRFTKPSAGWTSATQTDSFTSGVMSDRFGDALATTNDVTVVGAPDDNDSTGAAYVYANSQSTPPAITSTNSTTDTMRTPFDFRVTTTGTPAPTITETGALPSGVTFTDNGDGTADLAGTPAVGTAASYPITITASNGSGPDATQSFILTISAAKTVPVFTSADSDTVAYGSAFSYTVTTSGYPAPKITKSGSAPGLTFKDNGDGTATISGTPSGSASGPYTFNLTAKSSGGSATQTFTLTVTRAPTLANIKNVTTVVGNPLNVGVAAPTGYPAPAVMESGQLPDGIQFTVNPDDSSTFSGTPASGSGGTYSITVTATNASGTASRSFVLTVEQAPAFTSTNSYNATVGSPFTFNINASGSPAPKITESGSLPPGVKWNASSATLSGTPKKGTAGNYPLTFTATNKAGTQTQQFTLTVS